MSKQLLLPLSSRPHLALSLLAFAITFALTLSSVITNRQLEFMGGMAEEYVALGYNLELTGQFNPDQTAPFVFRPPGYPFFIASVFRLWEALTGQKDIFQTRAAIDRPSHTAKSAIYLAQSILAGLSALFLFLWTSRYTNPQHAIILALLFGCSPYPIVLAGFVHYDTLHLFFLILSGYILAIALESNSRPGPKILSAGIPWGLSTLIRPMTLILPAFVFIMILLSSRSSLKVATRASIIFTLGMILVIAPYSLRNYALTKRLIPVNAQTGVAMWAATTPHPKLSPNHYNWWDLWYRDGARICEKVARARECTPWHYVTHNLELEDEFRKRAVDSFYDNPGIFLKNFFHSFVSFNLGINSVFIKVFQAIQVSNKAIDIKTWLQPGNPQTFHSSAATLAFEFLIYTLTLLGFLGIAVAIWKRDRSLLVPGLLYCCFSIAHSITFMDLMYYYVKVPFLYIFAGFFISQLNPHSLRVPFCNRTVSVASIVNCLLVAYTAALNIAVLQSSKIG